MGVVGQNFPVKPFYVVSYGIALVFLLYKNLFEGNV